MLSHADKPANHQITEKQLSDLLLLKAIERITQTTNPAKKTEPAVKKTGSENYFFSSVIFAAVITTLVWAIKLKIGG